MMCKCDVDGCHFKANTTAKLTRHKQSHSTDTFFCSVCGNDHDFKTLQNLNKHEKTPSHKRKLDPEVAAAEEAEKATNKAAKDLKETVRQVRSCHF
jgi:hypothetical protein